MRTRLLVLCGLLCMAGIRPVVAQDAADDKPIPAAPAAPVKPIADSNTIIGPEDTLTIVALDSDEISKEWRVNAAGDIDLPLVGKVHAAGLTSGQLEKALTEKLKVFIRNPQVTVYVAEVRSQPITVAGAVHRPGVYQIENSKTLLAAIMLGGGPDASGPTVRVSRPVQSGPIPLPGAHLDEGGEHSSVELKLKDVLDPSTPEANLVMRPYDVVSVGMKERLVYIIGEVSRPGAVELATQDSVSVMQVLAAAGGLTKVAAPGHSEIMRINAQGLYERQGSVDLKKVLLGKTEDRLLKPGDIIVVPSSTVKAYTQLVATGGISSALTAGTYTILARF